MFGNFLSFIMFLSLLQILLCFILERRIKNVWLITDHHRLSTILHPKLKNFDCCIDEKEKSINVLKQEFQKHFPMSSSSSSNESHSPQINGKSSLPAPTNAIHKQKNLLSQCFDSKIINTSQSSNPYQEIDDYLATDFSQSFAGDDDECGDIDVLLFWREKQCTYPILSQISKLVCAIPASNTVIERLFSTAKNVVTENRTRLDCEKINQILFLQKNMKCLKELSNADICRKRTASASSTTTVSSEESGCTTSKQVRLDLEDSFDDIFPRL